MEKLVELKTNENGIAVITLKRDAKANALNDQLMCDLYDVLVNVESSMGYKVIVLKGGEKFFSAGMDVKAIHDASYSDSLNANFMGPKWTFLEEVSIPVISVVEGIAFGGGLELSLMADMVVASPKASFAFPEVNLGLIPGLGGIRKLFDLIGPQRAFEMVATGRVMDAKEALEVGLVGYLNDSPEAFAMGVAITMAGKPLTALKSIKKAFKCARKHLYSQDILYERQLFTALFETKEKIELTTKFLKK